MISSNWPLMLLVLAIGFCPAAPGSLLAADAAVSDRATVGEDDETIDNVAAEPVEETAFDVAYLDQIVFGGRGAGTAAAARDELDRYLRQRIVAIDLACELTESQSRKLRLAARGDVKRLFDRVDERRGVWQRAARGELNLNINWGDLQQQAWSLRDTVRSDPSGSGSLFERTQAHALTAAQLARCQAFAGSGRVTGIYFHEQPGTGDAVREIRFPGTIFGDKELARLRGMKTLESLVLDSTPVTDAGLVHLAGLTRLKEIDLGNTNINGAGLMHVEGLATLRDIDLTHTQVTSANLEHLQGLKGLRHLHLAGTPVTDAGLVYLKGLANLRQLDLDDTQITDAGLAHLAGLTTLQSLLLENSRVTDAGLAHLKGLAALKWLDLSGTQVTAAGVADLRRLLPATKIRR